MTKKKIEETKNKLYISYNESSEGGEISPGQENDDWPSHEPEYITLSIRDIFKNRPKDHWRIEEMEVDFVPKVGNTVFLIVVRYGTGDTFSNICGQSTFLSIYEKEEDALAEKELVESRKHKDDWRWDDYFGGLEGVEIHSFTIRI